MKDSAQFKEAQYSFGKINELAKQYVFNDKSKQKMFIPENIKDNIELKTIFDLCANVWSLIKVKQQIGLDTKHCYQYRTSFNAFSQITLTLFFSDFVKKTCLKQSFLRFLIQNFLELLEPLKNIYNADDLSTVFSVLEKLQNYAISHFSYEHVKSILTTFDKIENSFLLDASQQKDNLALKNKFDGLRKNAAVCFVEGSIKQFAVSSSKEIKFDIFENVQININNYLYYGDILYQVILNMEEYFDKNPVYKSSRNAVYYNLISLNWDNFLMCLKEDNFPLETIKETELYVTLKFKLTELEKFFEKEYASYESLLKTKLDLSKASHLAYLKLQILSLRKNVLEDTLKKIKSIIDNTYQEESSQLKKLKSSIGYLKKQLSIKTPILLRLAKEEQELLDKNQDFDHTSRGISDRYEEKIEKLIDSTCEHNKKYSAEINKLKSEIEILQKTHNRKSAKVERYFKGVNGNEKKLETLTEQVKEKKSTIEELDEQFKGLVQKFSEIKITENDYKYQNKSLLNRIQTTKVAIDELNSQISELRSQSSNNDENINLKLLELKQNINNLTLENRIKSEKLSEIKRTINQLVIQIKGLDKDVYRRRQRKLRLENDLNIIRSKNNLLDGLIARSQQPTLNDVEYLNSISTDRAIALFDYEVKVLREIKSHSKDKIQCFIYGGRVRDGILGNRPDDLDIVVFVPDALIQSVCQGYRQNPFIPNLYQKWVKDKNGKVSLTIDISIYPTGFLKEFLKKPALKVNALLADETGLVYDAHGGFKELIDLNRYYYITMIGNEYQRIQEDPFRIFRLLSTSKKLNRPLNKRTMDACYGCAEELIELPLGKYLSGLDKLFKHYAGEQVLEMLFLKEIQMLCTICPFLSCVEYSKLQSYFPFIKGKLNLINSYSYSKQLNNPHLSNVYMALLLFPLFCLGYDSQNIIQHFLRCKSFTQNDQTILKKLIPNVKYYLDAFNQDYLQNIKQAELYYQKGNPQKFRRGY